MNVRELMSPVEIFVSPDATVAEAARLLLDRNLFGMPVIEDGKLIGIVTRRDVVTKHAHAHLPIFIGLLGYVAPFELPGSREEVEHVLAVTVRDLMDDEVVTVNADADIDDVATLMADRSVDPIPVMERGRVIGIVSMADIVRLVLAEEGDGTT
jgi:CBS domain-containing protein